MLRSHKLLVIAAAAAVSCAVAGCNCPGEGDRDHHRHHASAHEEEATETRITMDAVPAKVRSAFEREFPGAKVMEIEKEVYKNGTIHYGFEFTHNGKKMEVEFDEDGEVLEDH